MRLPEQVVCGQCGKPMLHSAEFCHHCQAPNARSHEAGRLLVGMAALFFLWLVISRIFEGGGH